MTQQHSRDSLALAALYLHNVLEIREHRDWRFLPAHHLSHPIQEPIFLLNLFCTQNCHPHVIQAFVCYTFNLQIPRNQIDNDTTENCVVAKRFFCEFATLPTLFVGCICPFGLVLLTTVFKLSHVTTFSAAESFRHRIAVNFADMFT